jgi:hypothetical protein
MGEAAESLIARARALQGQEVWAIPTNEVIVFGCRVPDEDRVTGHGHPENWGQAQVLGTNLEVVADQKKTSPKPFIMTSRSQ